MKSLRSPLNVDVLGEGRDLVLLHGGAGSREDLAALRATPGARLAVLEDAGHGIHETRTADLAAIINRFLDADSPP